MAVSLQERRERRDNERSVNREKQADRRPRASGLDSVSVCSSPERTIHFCHVWKTQSAKVRSRRRLDPEPENGPVDGGEPRKAALALCCSQANTSTRGARCSPAALHRRLRSRGVARQSDGSRALLPRAHEDECEQQGPTDNAI